jgi:hypothetical protein
MRETEIGMRPLNIGWDALAREGENGGTERVICVSLV